MRVPAARIAFDAGDRRKVTELIDASLASGALTLGPLTKQLEEAFAAQHGVEHAIGVASGTAALEILLRTAEVAGGEVVVPANTFYATAGAVLHAGATPVFADVSTRTLALTVESVAAAVTQATRAVVLVHIAGIISEEALALRQWCDDQGLVLIEDAAHAHGCSLDGRSAGSFGMGGAFSFYPTKVVTTGEGGMIVTGSDVVRDEARIYRDQGKAGFLGNDHVRMGYAWRMSELAAAVGVVHLARLTEAIAARTAVATRYDDALSRLDGLEIVKPPAGAVCNYYKYVVLLPLGAERDQVKKALKEEHEVSLSGEVYTTPLHHQEVLKRYARGELPGADDVCARQVCLPVFTDMTSDEVDHVIASFTKVYEAL